VSWRQLHLFPVGRLAQELDHLASGVVARRLRAWGVCTVDATLPRRLLRDAQLLICLTPFEALSLTEAIWRLSLQTGIGLSLEEICDPHRIRWL
jgi:hypothetical protein